MIRSSPVLEMTLSLCHPRFWEKLGASEHCKAEEPRKFNPFVIGCFEEKHFRCTEGWGGVVHTRVTHRQLSHSTRPPPLLSLSYRFQVAILNWVNDRNSMLTLGKVVSSSRSVWPRSVFFRAIFRERVLPPVCLVTMCSVLNGVNTQVGWTSPCAS